MKIKMNWKSAADITKQVIRTNREGKRVTKTVVPAGNKTDREQEDETGGGR